jgi:hypothetical protein
VSKRHAYRITYERSVREWVCRVGGAFVSSGSDKAYVVQVAAGKALYAARMYGQLSEVVAHRRDGTIGRGPGSRRTYPRSSDPVRSRG